ncbi:putative nuclease HARBI1 [Hydra vulgaris]|uniref:putative nuclease HARBI1 n=1 Tax=Hydra vulgaris TaxID=6087 RepID=UPI001F5F7A5A|nr:putative nuclease HARBI1 [Hydra vulgaris]
MYLPQEAEVKEIMKQFEDMSSFPLVVGAVDGCHIRIKPPKKNPENYINRKDYHSIILKGFVDSRYLFRDRQVSRLGDSAYSLEEWLMKPYSDRGNLSREEKSFNFSLSRSCVVVENAFGRLKGRFQCISKRIDTSVENTVKIVSACCILHNFCEISNQSFSEDWLHGIDVNMIKISIRRNDSVRIEAEEIRSAIKQHISSCINLFDNN